MSAGPAHLCDRVKMLSRGPLFLPKHPCTNPLPSRTRLPIAFGQDIYIASSVSQYKVQDTNMQRAFFILWASHGKRDAGVDVNSIQCSRSNTSPKILVFYMEFGGQSLWAKLEVLLDQRLMESRAVEVSFIWQSLKSIHLQEHLWHLEELTITSHAMLWITKPVSTQ